MQRRGQRLGWRPRCMDLWMMDGKILGCVRMLVVGYWLWTDLVVCIPRRMKILGFLFICVSIAYLVNSSQSD
jgi:hypothetical protein